MIGLYKLVLKKEHFKTPEIEGWLLLIVKDIIHAGLWDQDITYPWRLLVIKHQGLRNPFSSNYHYTSKDADRKGFS